MITSELAAALRPSVGMRNVLVHGYFETDRGLVAAAVEQYGEYVRQVARFAAGRAT